jgi:lycopene beta-cyclase
VRLADRLACAIEPGSATSDIVRAVVTSYGREVWQQRSYFRLLNRMLFRAGEPDRRFSVLQRFYGFDQGLIERFYEARPTALDKLRTILGKPPVPILSALRCVSETRMLQQAEVVQ